MSFRLWKVSGWLIGVQPQFWTSPVVVEDPLFITRDDPIQKRSFWLCKRQRRTDFEMWQFLSIVLIMGKPLFKFFPFLSHGIWRTVLLPSHAPFVMGQSPPGSSNLRPDYCKSITSWLIFEAKISGTKFRKPTSNSAFINTIIAKCLVNFSGSFGSALVQF